MVKSLKEYLGLPTIAIGGLDSYHPIADLGDLPPRGQGSRDSRVTGLQANYTSQGVGTIKPMLTAQDKDPSDKDSKEIQKKNSPVKENQQAAIAVAKKKSGNYDDKGFRKEPYKEPDHPLRKTNKERESEKQYKDVKEDLYSDDNPNDTVKGTGYGDAATARKTLRIIKSVDKQRQMQIVNTLYNRAKHHANQTADMRAAMSIFKSWIDDKKIKESTLYKYMVDRKIIKD